MSMKESFPDEDDRMIQALNRDQMKHFPIIGDLEEHDIDTIYPLLKQHVYADGTVILRQGQSSESFHILISGMLDVYIEGERKVSVARLMPGHFFGEMSCLTGNEVSASVQAIGGVHTLSMPKAGILLLMDRSRSFRKHMIEAMIQRISESNDRVIAEYERSFAVMRQLELERKAAYGPLIGSGTFMQHLRQTIARLAAGQEPACFIGEKGVGKFHAAYEIHHQSVRSEFPILSVDGASFHLEEWEMKCRAAAEGTIVLEHADQLPGDLLHQILQSRSDARLILTANHQPKVNVERLKIVPLRERKEDIPELVRQFLIETGAANVQEAISNEALNMITAYPFLDGNIEELKRVVQDALVISGGKTILNKHLRFGHARKAGERPKIGLALGSGSSRGAAHVGVLKTLEQENIPVDIIAGTSVGAFIGALYAGGQPISAFESVLPTVKWRQLVQFTMPPKALVSNKPMARFVEKYIGPVHFHELNIPFAAVASDARSGEAYILNKGKVSHAICASTAIPGVMKPVNYEQRLLLDGAIVHPVPAALAKSMGADLVIAVDLSVPAFTKRAPKNFVASILNTIEMMSKKIVTDELQLADVILNPQIENHQISFKNSAALIQMGEKVTREALAVIKAKIQSESLR